MAGRERRTGTGPAGGGEGRRPSATLRTCVGCGGKAAPPDLVRLRLQDGRVVVDRDRSGGRGAWLHAAPACLERAIRRGAFARAFRAPAGADGATLAAQLTATSVRD